MSTIIQMAVLLSITDRATFWAMRFSLLFAGAAAIIYGAFTIMAQTAKRQSPPSKPAIAFPPETPVFRPRLSILPRRQW